MVLPSMIGSIRYGEDAGRGSGKYVAVLGETLGLEEAKKIQVILCDLVSIFVIAPFIQYQ